MNDYYDYTTDNDEKMELDRYYEKLVEDNEFCGNGDSFGVDLCNNCDFGMVFKKLLNG